MLKIIKPSEIDSVIGTEIGVSDWITIDQEQINKFAEATLDNQFIHVDPEAAKPIFGSTIAHGFLSLSLLAGISISQGSGLAIEGMKMGMNYGLDKVRFLAPVPVDSEVRTRTECIDITEKNPGQFLVKSKLLWKLKELRNLHILLKLLLCIFYSF
jgi:acyl dehydratase